MLHGGDFSGRFYFHFMSIVAILLLFIFIIIRNYSKYMYLSIVQIGTYEISCSVKKR